jgi:hypothetical protein
MAILNSFYHHPAAEFSLLYVELYIDFLSERISVQKQLKGQSDEIATSVFGAKRSHPGLKIKMWFNSYSNSRK